MKQMTLTTLGGQRPKGSVRHLSGFGLRHLSLLPFRNKVPVFQVGPELPPEITLISPLVLPSLAICFQGANGEPLQFHSHVLKETLNFALSGFLPFQSL